MAQEEITRLDNGERIYDDFGNYWYKYGEDDFRFYHVIDIENGIFDEDKYSLEEMLK